MATGRNSGRTTKLLIEALQRAADAPGSEVVFVAHNHSACLALQATSKRLAKAMGLLCKKRDNGAVEFWIDYPWGRRTSRVSFRAARSPQPEPTGPEQTYIYDHALEETVPKKEDEHERLDTGKGEAVPSETISPS